MRILVIGLLLLIALFVCVQYWLVKLEVIVDCRYAGRGVAASPATGSKNQHMKEHAHMLDDAFSM